MMHPRASGTSPRRARGTARTSRTVRYGLTAAITAVSLVVAGAPAYAAPGPDPELPEATTPWTTPGKPVTAPAVPSGTTTAPASEPEAERSAEVAAWRAAERARATGTAASAAPTARSAAKAATTDYVPEGQGQVPWHQFSDTRLSDALVARVNLSNGNLMLAATDFDIAGVGQKLQLTRTYNSLDAPWGKVSQRWWQGWERYLLVDTDEVVLFDATGDAVRFAKKADGTFTTPAGYSKDLKKNADGTYTLTTRSSGSKDTYDTHGTLTKVTDKNNGTITVDQHDEGSEHKGFKLTETRSGRWIDLVKTYANQWQAKDHTGRTAVFDLNSSGDLAKSTDTAGKATTYEYDSSRRLTKVTTPEGRATAFTYDAQNRVRSLQRLTGAGTGPTWTYAYSGSTPSAAGTTTATDPDGDKTVHIHNADGEITKVTDPLNHSRHRTYTNRQVQTATDAMGTGSGGTGGNVTTYGWDSRNNPTSAKLPTGANATAQYQTIAGTDLPSDMSNADGQKEKYTYDAAGNTLSVATTGAEGGERSYTYNKANPTCGGFEGQRCTAKDPNGKTTSFQYDAKGNLTKVTPPTPLGVTTYTYDALGRLETAIDGRGIKSVYDYDNRDRVVSVSSTTQTVTYAYDADGNTVSRKDASGTTGWAFDALNRESTRTLQNGVQTVLAYTPGGDVDWYTDANGKTDYTWDAAGRLDHLTDPGGKKTDFDYDNNDKRTKTTYPGGTTQTVTLDASGRPEAVKAVAGSATLVDLAYTYKYGTDGKSDGTKIRTRTDKAVQTTTTYVYDSQGRLHDVQPVKPGQPTTFTKFCYDKAGNLTDSGGACLPSAGYAYNDASQLISRNGSTTGWSYDKSGNETAGAPQDGTARTGEAWTDHSQLKAITTDGTTRDGVHAGTDNDERTKLGTTWFHTTALGLTGTTTAGTDTGFIREPAGTLNSMRTGGKSHYYLTDATGNVLGLVDDTGKRTHTYSYTAYGRPGTTTETVPQPYRYAGAYLDPTGLYKMGARYYDPTLGRFTQPDPSGQETNPYLYAGGRPGQQHGPDRIAQMSVLAR
ncbi:RHS repeat-associated core domain-containing protein [Streptomyces lichenis]|uniref:RHS repeat-associated core domain-containing protein n=1 Tax=Streptomyces lichenis TaxID=2306967 RepID=UPI0027E28E08|nr:RHS repeat-associated core domain-containing protein [Streptomyces lichenis]